MTVWRDKSLLDAGRTKDFAFHLDADPAPACTPITAALSLSVNWL